MLPAATLLMFLIVGCAHDSIGSRGTPADWARVLRTAETAHSVIRPAIDNDAELNNYLSSIGDRLQKAGQSLHPNADVGPVQFHLVDSDIRGAFSSGGEHIYIDRGLLAICQTEDDLAAAMAHAYAHTLDRQAVKRNIDESYEALGIVWQLASQPFDPDEEREADQDALKLFALAGWDPARFADIVSRAAGPSADGRTAELRQEAAAMEASSEKWRSVPVADAHSFRRIQLGVRKFHAPTDTNSQLSIRAFQHCLADRSATDREEALTQIVSLLPPRTVEPGVERGHFRDPSK